nr:MAG TPA: hypothetical protein [Caudoviricetes sp.]
MKCCCLCKLKAELIYSAFYNVNIKIGNTNVTQSNGILRHF